MNSPPQGRYASGLALLRDLSDRRGAPAGVHLQVADRCNHACQHCYQVQGRKGELSLDALRRVLDDLADAGVLTLNVSGGEATLRDDLLDILRHARARGFATRLYTNAFLVDDTLADALADIGLYEVHVSVYSAIAREHDAVTRVPGSWERTVAGVRALRARGLRVVLKCPVTAVATEGAPGVERLSDELGCAFRASTSMTAREDGALDPLVVAASPSQLVAAGLLRPWRPPPDHEALRRELLAVGSCGVGRSGVVVLPDGSVQPCTDTPLRVGNVLDEGMRAVLATETFALLRGLTRAHVHGCRDCDLMAACHRCHATALHEGGDYLGPYATACAHARARYEAAVGGVDVLPPAEGCPADRDPRVGPYRVEGEGRLRPIADVRTAEDEALVVRHPWLRRAVGAEKSPHLVPVNRLLRGRNGVEGPLPNAELCDT